MLFEFCAPLIFFYASSTFALYPSSSDVVPLTVANFDRLVTQSDAVWIVEFFAPWCGHCKALVPEYSKAATALKGVVKVGAVNIEENKLLAGRFQINGFPTIKIFNVDKNRPENYDSQRTAKAFVDAALAAVKKKINAQLPAKADPKSERTINTDDVVELSDANFNKLVLNSEHLWLVEFYSPWCGHCKNLAPHWAQAATELKGKMKLGAIDATAHKVKADEYKINGYPTIKFFPRNSTNKRAAQDYNDGRTSEDIVRWANEKILDLSPPPEIIELTSESALKKACEHQTLCVISILPNILDCQSECRNNYLNLLRMFAEKYKSKFWGWIWVEALAQPDLERVFEFGGFGYPTMGIVNFKKMKYSVFRGSFSKSGIEEFLRDLSFGRGRTAPVKGAQLPKIVSVAPWDGKDGQMPVEEDIDLSDVELDSKVEL